MKSAIKHMFATSVAVVALTWLGSPASAQGIPTYDVSTYLQALATVQNTEKMITQGEQVIATGASQLKSLQQLTNVNSIATTLEDTTVRNLLPGGTTNMSALLTGDFASLGTLGTQAQAIRSGYTITSTGNASIDAYYNQSLQNATSATATKAALGANTLVIAQKRTTDLEQLRTALDTAQDPKQVMDLNARIAVEQAHLQNDMLKMEALKMSMEAQKEANGAAAIAASGAAAQSTFLKASN